MLDRALEKKDFEMLQKLKEVFEDKISRGYASDSCSSAEQSYAQIRCRWKEADVGNGIIRGYDGVCICDGEYAFQDFYIRYYFLKRKSMEQC